MLNVLLADDEPYIIRGLAKLIDWESLGFTIIGEAYNGKELLSSIERSLPSLVIADISMPGMTGIDVLKEIQSRGLPTKVIFVSAYQEFSYAKDAVSYGAVDYLVKPVDRAKLEEVVMRTAALIRESTVQVTAQSRLQVFEQQQQQQRIGELFERLTDRERLGDLAETARELAGKHPGKCISVILVKPDESPETSGRWAEGEWKLLQFAAQNVMEDTVREIGVGWVVPKRECVYAIVAFSPQEAETAARRMLERLNRFLKVHAAVGTAGPDSLDRLGETYKRAEDAAAFQFFVGGNRVFADAALPAAPPRAMRTPEELESELVKAMGADRAEDRELLLAGWLQAVRSFSWGNREYAVQLGLTTLISCYREAFRLGKISEARDESVLAPKLRGFETLDELGNFVRLELERLQGTHSGKSVGKEAAQLKQVREYIASHYAEEINLERMAALVYMNASYFSSFFKKHTGQNFKQYVTEIRMQHALRMLLQTDSMVYEVAERVGYNNARQFSDMFKKHYGKLPNEYR